MNLLITPLRRSRIVIPTLTSAADAQSFVDARLAEGSDYIKIIYDDGKAFGQPMPTLGKEELATDALAAATSVPARVFGLPDRGRIVPGLRADLLLVKGDVLQSITATRDIVAVWKTGAEVKRKAAGSR
jgi:hypothetical protein